VIVGEVMTAIPPMHEVIQLLRDWETGILVVALLWAFNR
jgi:hypothetical protein